MKSLCRFCQNVKKVERTCFSTVQACEMCVALPRMPRIKSSRAQLFGGRRQVRASLEFEFDLVQVDRVGSTGGSADEAVAWAGGSAQVRLRDGVVRRVDCFSISEDRRKT